MRPLVVVGTRNRKKLNEIIEILGDLPVEFADLSRWPETPEVVEDGATFEENARKKACATARHLGHWVLAEDSGLVVPGLGGRPGVYSARYAGPEADARANNVKLLAALAGLPPAARGARFRCAMVFVRDAHDAAPIVTEASWPGRVACELRGAGGFGYDPLFIVAGGDRTIAEMPEAEKNRVSHRGQALVALAAAMREAGW